MAEEKQIALSYAEYPSLEGLKPGEKVKVQADGEITGDMEDGKSVIIQLDNCQVETENQADRELKKLSNKEESTPSNYDEEDSF